MDIKERIEKLNEFREAVATWNDTRDAARRAELRKYISQNRPTVEREVLEAGQLKYLTITPPPAVGGLVMRNVNPFDMLFDPPYLMSMAPHVLDMIDQTVGVMSSPDFEEKSGHESEVHIQDDVESGYVFVAMPIDESDPNLEDVLDAVKEACERCGLKAERVDEPHSNERITDRILESIVKAEYVVVDLTDSRPNVFYEAGFAQGRGKTPIYIAREETNLEFDLKDYPVIFFNNMKGLKEKLEARLRGLADERS